MAGRPPGASPVAIRWRQFEEGHQVPVQGRALGRSRSSRSDGANEHPAMNRRAWRPLAGRPPGATARRDSAVTSIRGGPRSWRCTIETRRVDVGACCHFSPHTDPHVFGQGMLPPFTQGEPLRLTARPSGISLSSDRDCDRGRSCHIGGRTPWRFVDCCCVFGVAGWTAASAERPVLRVARLGA